MVEVTNSTKVGNHHHGKTACYNCHMIGIGKGEEVVAVARNLGGVALDRPYSYIYIYNYTSIYICIINYF